MAIASAYKDHNGMTLKMRLFCEHYLSSNFDRTAAIRSAYGKDKSDKVCWAMASENLRKPAIIKYLENRMKEALEKAGVGLEWRLNVLKQTAEASLNGSTSKDGLVNPDGAIKSVAELNKMEGTYAPVQSESKVTLSDVDNKHVDELIEKYQKDT